MWIGIAGAIILLFGFVVFFGAPYVPSQRRYIRRALTELYQLGEGDVLVDVGSGDGVVLRQAAGLGARAVGYELNPLLVVVSRWLSRRSGDRVSVRLANFWAAALPDETTVVYSFGVGRDVQKLEAKVQAEANRLGRPLVLLSLGHELPRPAERSFEAYHRYAFYPLQASEA
jgi:hypothetical protein